jgi:integrase/recombinase XerD
MDYLVLERQTLTINPIKPSHFLRQGRPLPKKLSQDQVGTLLAQVTNPMDHALELLGLRCGLRVSEVAHLRRSDLDWEQQALRIDQGKGARMCMVRLPCRLRNKKPHL